MMELNLLSLFFLAVSWKLLEKSPQSSKESRLDFFIKAGFTADEMRAFVSFSDLAEAFIDITKSAEPLLQALEENSLQNFAQNFLLRMFLQQQDFESAEQVLTYSAAEGSCLPFEDWERIITQLARAGMGLEAEGAMYVMTLYGHQPLPSMYVDIVESYARQGKHKMVERLLIGMSIGKILPTTALYRAALLAYPGGQSLEGLQQFTKAMTSYHHHLNFGHIKSLHHQLSRDSPARGNAAALSQASGMTGLVPAEPVANEKAHQLLNSRAKSSGPNSVDSKKREVG